MSQRKPWILNFLSTIIMLGYSTRGLCSPKSKILYLGLLLFSTSVWAEIGKPSLTEAVSATLPTTQPSPHVTDTTVPDYVLIRPSDQVTFSSEITASISAINVKEGTAFHAGDVLLQMDCRVQQADLQKASAQQQATEAALKSATKLKSYGSISDFELTQAQTQSQMANAEVSKLQAIVEKCTITAPFNGAVSDLMVHAHETVKPGDPLIKIVNTENLDFEMQVPSSWLSWLHINSIFNVHVNETNKTVAVKVSKINPQIDSISQTVRIVGILVEPDESLLPGMTGQAVFPENPNLNRKITKP